MERRGNVGDMIDIGPTRLGETRRVAEIIAVLGWGDEVHFRIRWADGHESTFFPGPGSCVVQRTAYVASAAK